MIIIEYTNESIEGEPGPNLYWRGPRSDFLKLFTDIHFLGSNVGTEVHLGSSDYISIEGVNEVTLRSSANGLDLCRKNNSHITMDLEPVLWRRVFEKLLSVTYEPSHNYIEFDELDLYESANVIIAST